MADVTHGSDDGDGPDADEQDAPGMFGIPDNELPVPVAESAVLARGDGVVIALVGGRAYTCGMELHVAVRRRNEGSAEETDLNEMVMGWPHDRGEPRGLALGIGYADGRRTTTIGHYEEPPDEFTSSGAESISIDELGFNGGPGHVDITFWVHPLPPPGPLTIAVLCEGLEIEETVSTLDATIWWEAGSRAEVQWPWQPPMDVAWEPPRANVPAGGWFDATLHPRGTEEDQL